jgi:hypothetical protein
MIRVLLIVGLLLLLALALVGMRLGWRHRAERQAGLPELPIPPQDVGADQAPPLTGLYVGTTFATQWQNRIVARRLGERAEAVTRIGPAGILIDRQGSTAIFLPIVALTGARLEPALAGKVVGQGGLLVLRWRHGDVDLDTGLRADDKTVYPAWIQAVAKGVNAR